MRVAAAPAHAEQRRVDDRRAGLNGGEAVGIREEQVVVPVKADLGIEAGLQDLDVCGDLGRQHPTRAIHDGHRRRAMLDDRNGALQELERLRRVRLHEVVEDLEAE